MTQSVYLHKNDHVLGARILLRSAFETVGVLIYSNQEMRRVVGGQLDFHEFSSRTKRLLLGSRDKSTNFEAMSILTVLQRADKKYPGLYAWYEGLCESAHPNCEGMLAGYSVSDSTEFVTNFLNRWEPLHGTNHLASMAAFMRVFDAEYNNEWPEAFEALERWIESHHDALESTKAHE